VSYFLNRLNLEWLLTVRKALLDTGKYPSPKYVVWDVSRKCNLNCQHCGAKDKEYSKELTTKQIKKVIKNLSEIGTEYFTVTGGEPLLRPDIIEIFEYASMLKLKTGIATNGFTLDAKTAKDLSKMGLNTIQISLDGPQKIHNKIRNNSISYQRAIKAIDLIKKEGLHLTISSVITSINLPFLKDIKKVITEKQANIWKIVTIMPIGNAINRDFYLSEKEFKELLKFIKENKKKAHIEFGENCGYLGEWDKKVRFSPFFCPVGILACCIGVDGNIRGCPEQPDIDYFREGSVLKNNFETIWLKGFQKYRNRDVTKIDKHCKECKVLKKCFGGCWVMRQNRTQCSINKYNLNSNYRA
jgi:radical SAM protein with 4Fe4S-binding SPASM domain